MLPPKEKLKDLADAAEVDLVGRLALAPGDGGEEECPGVAVAGVAVGAEADSDPLLLQFSLFSPRLLLVLNIPAALVPAMEKKINRKFVHFVFICNQNKKHFFKYLPRF